MPAYAFKYGISTSILNIRRHESIVDGVKFAIKNDFVHVEIIADGYYHVLLLRDNEIEAVRELSKKHKISLSIHAPFYSIDLASLSERMRKFAIEEITNAMHFGREIDAKWVTIHLGFNFYPTKVLWKKVFQRLSDSLDKLLKLAEDLNLLVSMELRSGYFDLGHPALLDKLLKKFDTEILGVTIDTAQAVGFPKMTMEEIIEHFAPKIISFHVRDVDPKLSKDMLACGEGVIDWSNFIDLLLRLHLKVPLIFEVSDKEGALFSRDYLENLIYTKLNPEVQEEIEEVIAVE